MTEALTGQKSFKTFTNKIGKTENENCTHYGEWNTSIPTFFECEQLKLKRHQTRVKIREKLTIKNIGRKLRSAQASCKEYYGDKEEREHQTTIEDRLPQLRMLNKRYHRGESGEMVLLGELSLH